MAPADPPDPEPHSVAANDNGADPETLRRVDDIALQLARIIGRRMAREDFAAHIAAANDNAPKPSGEPSGGADKE